jgi:hypothetical protein
MATGTALAASGGGALATLALLALIAAVAGGGAAMGMTVQQHQLGHAPALAPLAVARWAGALLAAVGGPLVTAAVGLAVLVGLGSLLVPAENSGSMAGVGGVALARDPEIREVIALAEGHEWSLVPVGVVLSLAVLLCAGGIAGLALGVVPASLAIVAGLVVLVPASAALARRWEQLARAV